MLEGDIKKTIAIDFDGTIVEFKFPDIGGLKPFAKETIKVLKEKGHRIIIWSCRGKDKEDEVRIFLEENEIPYDVINDHTSEDKERIPDLNYIRKVFADIYIDDRNIFWIDDWKFIAERLGIWKEVLILWKKKMALV